MGKGFSRGICNVIIAIYGRSLIILWLLTTIFFHFINVIVLILTLYFGTYLFKSLQRNLFF